MSDAGWIVQAGIFDLLTAGLSGVPVYDHVPEGAQLPYVTIGEDTVIPADDKICTGQDITLTIHSWSEAPGRKEVKQIMGRVYELLHNAVFPVEGFTLRRMQFEFGQSLRDADGVTYHGVQRFRIVVDAV